MQAKEIMTKEPVCCIPETGLQAIAQMMLEYDCGEIPVVDNLDSYKPIGVITDRDIVCRSIAKGQNPLTMTARDCLSSPCVTIAENASLEECCHVLEENQIRRVPVVDASGRCSGIVALADVARRASEMKSAEVLKQISQ